MLPALIAFHTSGTGVSPVISFLFNYFKSAIPASHRSIGQRLNDQTTENSNPANHLQRFQQQILLDCNPISVLFFHATPYNKVIRCYSSRERDRTEDQANHRGSLHRCLLQEITPKLRRGPLVEFLDSRDLIDPQVHANPHSGVVVHLTGRDRQSIRVLDEVAVTARHNDMKRRKCFLPLQVLDRVERRLVVVSHAPSPSHQIPILILAPNTLLLLKLDVKPKASDLIAQ